MPELGDLGEASFAEALLNKAPEGFLSPEPIAGDTEPEAPPRDEHGRFAPKDATPDTPDTPAEPEVEAGAATEGTTEEAVTAEDDGPYLEVSDPGIIAYLQKYDGDIEKALKAAVESQTLIGRQGGELGDLRTELQALKEAFEEGSRPSQPQLSGIPGAGFAAVQSIADSGRPQLAAQMAYQQNDPVALEYAVSVWKEEEPFEAALFVSRVERAWEQAAVAAPTTQVDVQQQTALDGAIQSVIDKHPDIHQFIPAIGEIASEMPMLGTALETGTPVQRAQALDTLTTIAKSRQGADTTQALESVRIRLKAEGDQARSDAAVVSATTRATPQTAPSRSEEELLPGFTRGKFREIMGLPPIEE